VGTGIGDIPRAARAAAATIGHPLEVMGVELSEPAARVARTAAGAAAVADGFTLPFADHSVDLVTCSQVLHHFDAEAGARLLRELDRVARVRVIVSEIRRSWAAAAGVWLASFPLGFHANSRQDGVTSVLRGFTAAELAALVDVAVKRRAVARRRAGFRVTAHWTPLLVS
jgi:ubiquinone/menaquinone biosynthesis C-methylase UbiE